MKAWTKAPLGEVCEVNIGRTPARNRSDFWGDGHAWLSIADMNQGRDLRTTKETITDLAIRECNCREAKIGTVLLSFKLSIGKVGIAQIPLFTNEAIAALPIQDGTRLGGEYLYWALQSVDLTLGLDRAAMGLTLNKAKLLNIEIPLPPLAEQRRIAEVLDRAEALRAKRRAALAQLDSLTQSLFLDLLRQAGKDVATVSIEDGMEAIIDYRGKSPTKTESGVPLVTARVVKGGELLEPNEFIAEEDYDDWMRRGFPKAGDVLFTTEAPLGEVAQLDGRKVALAQRLLVLRGKPSLLDNTFLMHAMTAQVVRDQINARATGSTVRGIRQRELRKVMLPVPPIPLQREFARRVTAVEALKTAQRASLAELDALFATLQHRAFRGDL